MVDLYVDVIFIDEIVDGYEGGEVEPGTDPHQTGVLEEVETLHQTQGKHNQGAQNCDRALSLQIPMVAVRLLRENSDHN